MKPLPLVLALVPFAFTLLLQDERSMTLSCSRDAGVCTIVNAYPFYKRTRTVPLADVRATKIEQANAGDRELEYRVYLVTDSGDVPLSSAFGEKQNKEHVVFDTEMFMRDPEAKTLRTEDSRGFGLEVVTGVVALGCWISALVLVVRRRRSATRRT